MPTPMESINSQIERIKRIYNQLEGKLMTIETTMSVQREDEKTLLARVLSLEQSVARKEIRLKELHEVLMTSEYARGALAVLDHGFSGLAGCTASLLSYSDEVRPWIERALGRLLFALVFDTTQSAKQAVKWLKKENKGRALCIAADQIPSSYEYSSPSAQANAPSLSQFVTCPPNMTHIRNFLLGKIYRVDADLYEYGFINGGSDETLSLPPQSPWKDYYQNNGVIPLERLFVEAVKLHEELNDEQARIRQFLEDIESFQADKGKPEEAELLLEKFKFEREQLQQTLISLDKSIERSNERAANENAQPAVELPSQSPPSPVPIPDVESLPEQASKVSEVEIAESTEPFAAASAIIFETPSYDKEQLSKFKVLVVDDDPESCDLARFALENIGLKVEVAENSDEAMDRVDSDDFDLLVIDLVMPGKNGWQLRKMLKFNQRTKEVPVIILSVITPSPADIKMWVGAKTDFFQKPLDGRVVQKIVSILMSK